MAKSDTDRVLARIRGFEPFHVFTPKDFLDLASHESARQTLSRLARDGTIRRLLRGVYDRPVFSKILNTPARPDPDAIARAIARAHGWTSLPAGDTALNLLGLSTQVPAQWQYFSDGPTKKYEWDGGTIVFKRRANKETTSISARTALLVQALKTLGKDRVDEGVISMLRSKFSAKELAKARSEAKFITSWVYEVIRRLDADKGKSHV